MRPTELLKKSADPFDEACIKVKELEDTLQFLVDLKDYKDTYGKDDYYLEQQPRVWERARNVLKWDE